MPATSNDRRTRSRQKSFLQGRLYFNNRRSSLDCVVRDFTKQGAKLQVSDSVAIPDAFELYIPNKDEIYHTRVLRRTGDELGVAFELDMESPSIVPGAPSGDLGMRVQRLETEVAKLQRKVHELQRELQMRHSPEI